jgi:hypothetical protein
MIVNPVLHRLFKPLEDTGGTDTAVDFGDEHEATETTPDEDAEAARALAEKEADEAAQKEKDAEAKTGEAKDDEDKPKDKKVDTRVPLARHKELLKKEREAREAVEEQLAKFKGGEQIAQTNEKITEDETKLVALEGEYAQLVTDGDHVKAAAKMGEIRKIERGINDAKSTMAIQAAESRAYERVKYDTTCDRLEEAYPVLDRKHEDYDPEVEKEVVQLMGAYRTMGLTPSDAIQKAAKNILGAATKKQDTAVTVDVRVDKDDVAKQIAKDRKEGAVKKALETAKKQPASTAGVGADSDKAGGGIIDPKSILSMKHNDFIKLDEAALSKLRGDEL